MRSFVEDSGTCETFVREFGAGNLLVELRGEFDLHGLDRLRSILSGVTSLRRLTIVDLSGVTFLDVQSTREVVLFSRLYSHHLVLRDPSPEVRASMEACGIVGWGRPHPVPDPLDAFG